MERYTEYHCGVAVIKDKSLMKDAMAKLARLEDMRDIPSLICDEYCRYPREAKDQDELIEEHCMECMLGSLFIELSESHEPDRQQEPHKITQEEREEFFREE